MLATARPKGPLLAEDCLEDPKIGTGEASLLELWLEIPFAVDVRLSSPTA